GSRPTRRSHPRRSDRGLRRRRAESAEGAARRQGRDGSGRASERLSAAARHPLFLMRYSLTLEYDGTPFVGWQRQDNAPSVQGALEAAIEKLSGERVTVTGAGRTDAGVHALGQAAHFDLVKAFEPGKVRDALNHYLRPDPVAVLDAAAVDGEFSARFSAK